ncbi:dihydrofolate reductase family protein [Microlunatus parietis]|uniref:Dihydrofolate reductase n=1 Tax=Microlunatus parietis TaxID=682979 RepID=A0A7Y9IBC7_9ACTN|nr:dihydrofolate reductase family protein [Microlunatus parietis]NYE73803.1 dihydrofolate reductase [Microlunatus parietis]
MTRTVSVELFCSVDGYGFAKDYPAYFGYGGPDLDRWIDARTSAPHVEVMGRQTYQDLVEIVASREDPSSAVGDGGSFEELKRMPKIIFSSTLTEPPVWPNATLIAEDAVPAVTRLKQEPGDPLRVIGSLSLGCSLIRAGLVDQVSLVVFPLLVGRSGGKPILTEVDDHGLELTGSEVLDGRLIALDYRLAPAAA